MKIRAVNPTRRDSGETPGDVQTGTGNVPRGFPTLFARTGAELFTIHQKPPVKHPAEKKAGFLGSACHYFSRHAERAAQPSKNGGLVVQ